MIPFFIKTVGVLLIALGTMFLFDNKKFQSFISFFKRGNNIYLAGIIKVILGLLFLAAFADTNVFIFIIGLLSLIGGIVIFILGPKRLNKYVDFWVVKMSKNICWIAICYLVMGVLLIYSV